MGWKAAVFVWTIWDAEEWANGKTLTAKLKWNSFL